MRTTRSLVGRALVGLAVFLGPAALAQAGTFSVNPVRVTLSAGQPIGAITVRNAGSEPTLVQLDTSSWSQANGADVLTPSTDMIATPPMFTLPPGGTQIVRVGLRRRPDSKQESTYRLVLREVPSATKVGVRVALNISMPIFVLPANATGADVKWRALRTSDGKIRLVADNSGSAHAQVRKISVVMKDGGETIATQRAGEYVLPANSRSWLVQSSAPSIGTLLRVSSDTDAGEFHSDVPLENDVADVVAPATAAR